MENPSRFFSLLAVLAWIIASGQPIMSKAPHRLKLVACIYRVMREWAMTHEPVVIRQATVDDIPFLRMMMREALLASPTFLAHHDIEGLDQAEEQEWSQWRQRPDPAFIAVDASGRSIGAIRLRSHASVDGQGWQFGIGVEAGAREQGIGRRLIERAITYARATGAPYLNLVVDPTNLPAITLYHRTGFVEIGEREHLIEMRLSLDEHAR